MQNHEGGTKNKLCEVECDKSAQYRHAEDSKARASAEMQHLQFTTPSARHS